MSLHPDSRIFRLNEERSAIVEEVVRRELAEKTRTDVAMELALNDTAYSEIARLEGDKRHQEKLREWMDLYRTLGRKTGDEKRELLDKLIHQYAWDIVGNFDRGVYNFATRVVPRGLGFLFRNQLGGATTAKVNERIVFTGHVDAMHAMAEKGTVILVPTHSSNLDSIVVGYALFTLGLPPFTYGAGKNLFTNPLLSYFMNHLGAYKVDRRLRQGLYKDALKTYSTVILERGYHSLFFPGGGRARSGEIENKLKLGLLGTGLAAYINNLRAGKPNPNVYIVPMTINYPLVLEAATLIDDHLKAIGKSRYIIEDDESTKLGRIWSFGRAVLAFNGKMFLQFGRPIDPFGNRVELDGTSVDQRGRPIDLRKYVEIEGEPRHDANRDAEYTRELGASIVDAFHRNNVVLSTHLVAFVLYQLLAAANPQLDVYRLIRLPADTAIPIERVLEAIARMRDRLVIEMAAGRIMVSPTVQSESVERILETALGYFRMYHLKHLIVKEGDQLLYNDIKLLLYYRNRLVGYGFEKVLAEEPLRLEVAHG